MENRTLNFDNFMVEKTGEPILVTVFGKEYKVSPEIPAIVMVTLARTNEPTVSDTEATKMILQAGDVMFGKDVINELCAKGIRSVQLVQLIKMVFELINGKDIDGDDVEEISDEDGMVSSGSKAKK